MRERRTRPASIFFLLLVVPVVLGASRELPPIEAGRDGAPPVFEVYERTIAVGGMPVRIVGRADGTFIVVDADGTLTRIGADLGIVARAREPREPRWRAGSPLPTRELPVEWPEPERPVRRAVPSSVDALPPVDVGAFDPARFGARPGFFCHPAVVRRFGGGAYVVDTGNHRVQVFDGNGTLVGRFGLHQIEPRQGEGRLHYPSDIALSADRTRALVTEPLEGRIQVFRTRRRDDPPPDPASTWVRADLPAHFGEHWAVSGEWLLVAEPDAVRVALHRLREGKEPVRVAELGRTPGRALGRFLLPSTVHRLSPDAVGNPRFLVHDPPSGRVVVVGVDPGDGSLRSDPRQLFVIAALDLPPSVVVAAGGPESTPGEPVIWSGHERIVVRHALAVEPGDTVVPLIERGTIRSLHVDPRSGELLACVDESEGTAIALRDPSDREGATRMLRSPVIAALDPCDVAFLDDGSFLVSDGRHHRLVRLDRDGVVLATIGGPGTGRVEFHHPRGLSVDEAGRVWVLDHGNHRGQVITADGTFVQAFGSRPYLEEIRRWEAERKSAGGGER